jgi:hypothetical protein
MEPFIVCEEGLSSVGPGGYSRDQRDGRNCKEQNFHPKAESFEIMRVIPICT